MSTLSDQAKSIEQAQQQINLRRSEYEQARANLPNVGQVIGKQARRTTTRTQRRAIAAQIEAQGEQLDEYGKQIEQTQTSIDKSRSDVQQYMEQEKAYEEADRIWLSIDKTVPREVALSKYSGRLREVLEDYYDQNAGAIEKFNNDVAQFEAENRGENLLVDAQNLKVIGVESDRYQMSFPSIEAYNTYAQKYYDKNKEAYYKEMRNLPEGGYSSAYPESYPAGTPVITMMAPPTPKTNQERFQEYIDSQIEAQKQSQIESINKSKSFLVASGAWLGESAGKVISSVTGLPGVKDFGKSVGGFVGSAVNYADSGTTAEALFSKKTLSTANPIFVGATQALTQNPNPRGIINSISLWGAGKSGVNPFTVFNREAPAIYSAVKEFYKFPNGYSALFGYAQSKQRRERITSDIFKMPETPAEWLLLTGTGAAMGAGANVLLKGAESIVGSKLSANVLGKGFAKAAPKYVMPVFSGGLALGGLAYATASENTSDKVGGILLGALGAYSLYRWAKVTPFEVRLTNPRVKYNTFISLTSEDTTSTFGKIDISNRYRYTTSFLDKLLRNPPVKELVSKATTYNVVVTTRPTKIEGIFTAKTELQKAGSNVVKSEAGLLLSKKPSPADVELIEKELIKYGENPADVLKFKRTLPLTLLPKRGVREMYYIGSPWQKTTYKSYMKFFPVEGSNPIELTYKGTGVTDLTPKTILGSGFSKSKPAKVRLFFSKEGVTADVPYKGDMVMQDFKGVKGFSILRSGTRGQPVRIRFVGITEEPKPDKIIFKGSKTVIGDNINSILNRKSNINLGDLVEKTKTVDILKKAEPILPPSKLFKPKTKVISAVVGRVGTGILGLGALSFPVASARPYIPENEGKLSMRMVNPDTVKEPKEDFFVTDTNVTTIKPSVDIGTDFRSKFRTTSNFKEGNNMRDNIKPIEDVKPSERSLLNPRTNMDTRTRLRERLREGMRDLLASKNIAKTIQSRSKLKTPIARIMFGLPSKTKDTVLESKGSKGNKFDVFVRQNRKDIKIENDVSLDVAKKSLKSKLLGTLRASGYITGEGGKKLSFEEVGLEGDIFRPSKKESGRIVQRSRRRLVTFGERKEIVKSRRKSKWL